jgi:hypothetical protein
LKIPIPQIPLSVQKPFEDLVAEILLKKSKNEDTQQSLEDTIDNMVFELYGLTEEEIAVITSRKS